MSKADYIVDGMIIEVDHGSGERLANISRIYMDKVRDLLSEEGGASENEGI